MTIDSVKLREWIQDELQDDVLSLSWLDGTVERITGEKDVDKRREILLPVLQQLLEDHSAFAGFQTSDDRFIVLPGTPTEIIQSIKSQWLLLDRALLPGDITWFARPELVSS